MNEILKSAILELAQTNNLKILKSRLSKEQRDALVSDPLVKTLIDKTASFANFNDAIAVKVDSIDAFRALVKML